MRRLAIGHSMAIAAAAALLGMEAVAPSHLETRRRFDTGRQRELTRKQARAADRSKKQYLLKGIRP